MINVVDDDDDNEDDDDDDVGLKKQQKIKHWLRSGFRSMLMTSQQKIRCRLRSRFDFVSPPGRTRLESFFEP